MGLNVCVHESKEAEIAWLFGSSENGGLRQLRLVRIPAPMTYAGANPNRVLRLNQGCVRFQRDYQPLA